MNPLRKFRFYRKLFNRRSWIKVHRDNAPCWVRRWEILDSDLDAGEWERGHGRTSRHDSEPMPQDA
ncbi:MAG TPA: hypothetical protein VNU25_02325 [Candidatus Paceibacterota bacterium]|nr:hypothetical protein [Candidatus Paceibacterota bacterium]